MSDATWPAGFPLLPGGTPLPASPAAGVALSLLAFDGVMPLELDTRLRAALAADGWAIDGASTQPEAIRFRTLKDGKVVSVSIRDDRGRAILQVMSFS